MSDLAAPLDSTNDLETEYALLRESCGVLASFPMAFLRITGEDRKAWLQGQVTNDMRQLHPEGSLGACFCSATGQIVAACRIWHLGDAYMIGTHRDAIAAVMQRFQTMVVMEDVQAEWLSDWQCLSLQGPTATRTLGERTHLPNLDAAKLDLGSAQGYVLRADHSGLGGWDMLYPNSAEKSVARLAKGLTQVGDEALNIAQIESGIPRFGIDLTARTLPPEMGPAFSNRMISYSKGCYLGQEVLMRIHSRGHTNRTWVGLFADAVVPPGASLACGQKEDVGTITRSGDSPRFGPIAAGMIRNEFATNGEIVRIQTPDGPVEAEVRTMPLLRFD
jgi:folate-binding protein YgfZ